MSGVDITLDERGLRYGEFVEQARISQAIKIALVSGESWIRLSDDKREALEMIAVKLARIVNGDPFYVDSWHDVAGYALLVKRKMTK